MAHDTLVVICRNTAEAKIAAAKVPREHDLNRFFVFLGKRPNDHELSWLTAPDAQICIERAIDWSDDAEGIGVRAGLMYTSGWDLLFCHANKMPTTEEVSEVRSELKSSSISNRANVWGMRREHFVLYSLPQYVGVATNTTVSETELHPVHEEILLGKALKGVAVPERIALRAIPEVASVNRMKGIFGSNDPHYELLRRVTALGNNDNSTPLSIVIETNASEYTLEKYRHLIANNGAVIKIASNSINAATKPYKVLKIDNGVELQLFSKL